MPRLIPVAVLALLAAAACTPANRTGTTVTTGPVNTTHIQTEGGTVALNLTPETLRSSHFLRVPADSVWKHLPGVYRELGIEPATMVTDQWVVGNRNARFNRRIAGEVASTYINCGISAIGAPIANNANVRLEIVSQLTPGEAGTEIRTILIAYAIPRGGSSAEVRCPTTGRLEERIAARLSQLSGAR